MHLIPFLAIAIFLALIYAFAHFQESKHDPKEPPFLPQKIPFIGHIIGMIQKKARYYVHLRQRYAAPIYSLLMPQGSKIYVVTSTELISAVQRQPRILSFPPIGVKFAMSLSGSSPSANKIATNNINGDEGDWGLSMEFNKAVYPALSPGPHLEAMNRIMIPHIAESLDKLRKGEDGGRRRRIVLGKWIRHELSRAITDSVYGPQNPFKDRAVEDAFWDYENELFRIMMNLLPGLTARKGMRGRRLLGSAFLKYFQNGGLKDASVFAQNRFDSWNNHELALEDIARFEVVTLIGTLTSTIRTVTWMLYHIYSTPSILAELREEIPAVMSTSSTPQGVTLRSLDITRLRANCPILGSTFQEVLRWHALGTAVRQVMCDTILENKYLLKKDSMVLMPSVVLHTDPNLWGPDVGAFNHKRFLRQGSSTAKSGTCKTPSPSAFRGFGGGTTLCPGRHFATTTTMAVTIMFLMRYDVVPVEGRWPKMTGEKTGVVSAVEQPDHEVEVDVRARKGFEEGEWSFRMDNSDTVFAMAVEDFE